MLGLLTGHFAVRRAGGQLGREQARRLWAALPLATQAILAHGPQLLDVFVSGNRLLARAAAAAPADADWLMALQSKVARRQDRPGELEQAALFGQFSDVLRFLAQRHPLLIILDDLQWIDGASIGLLFQLGRHLAGNHILIVGAYRPDELPRAHAGEPHSLLQILDEFRRRYGDVFIDLARADQVEGRSFVDALVDTEPNRLDGSFRQALFRQTGGHPLFTVELLRDMQSRGDLIQDEAGQWCEGQALDWATFPARVEAVVARRIGRLDDEMREILAVASVEGERFTAKVVARVLGRKERPLLHALSQQLQSQHRLVREEGEVEIGGEYLSLYRFGHALFQQYLYSQLSPGERRHLHRDVGEALELLFAADLDQVAVQLGHHYTAAAAWHKAVSYLIRAADLAYQRASLAEAVRHYQSALAHWIGSDGPGKAGAQRKLGECLWMLDRHTEAIEALQVSYELYHRADNTEGAAVAQQWLGRVYWELGKASKAAGCYQCALTLLEGEPESEALAWALTGLSEYYMHVSNYERSVALGEQALALARRLGAEVLVIRCLCDLGSALSGMGDWTGLAMEQESLERALTLNRPHDAGRAYVYIAEALIYLGRYREARDILEEALAYTRRMQVRYIAVAASRQLAHLDWLTGRWSRALAQLQKVDVRLRQEHAAGLGRLYLAITLGRVHNDLGQPETARKQLVEAETGTLDSLDPRVAFLGELARAEMMSGRPAEAATAAAEILEWTDQAPYLYPNVAMALLFICSAPVAYGRSTMAGHARSACQQLQRLDKQYRTRVTTACRLEGQGWLSLTEAQAAEAVPSFKQAVAGWQRLGRPHDLARALSGLSQALLGAGDDDGARLASEQAMELVDALATQLEDPVLRASFLESALVGLRGSGGASDS